ncbi:MAG TPA: murein biosynthesis integral membrane protein MurJ, partial [Alphaproteobacteria bacterium]|nr:murein biosynthesis integral membrane protein MurJ [Alphaproteobacteria bacterium]
MLKSILTNSTFTMISRILGFIRDVITAHFLGAGLVSDCFFIAFKTPNFFRRLFAEGAFNAAFVPMFSKTLESAPDPVLAKLQAREFAEQILAVLLLSLLLIFGLFEIFMPYAMYAMAPGFIGDAQRFPLAVALTRITFPYMLFISLVSLYSGILNAFMRFAVTAAAPALLNIALITALVGFASVAKTPGHALAWGVAAAGVLQLIWVASAAGRMGMGLRLRIPRFGKDVMAFMRLIAPAALGAGGIQLNLMMDNILATFLSKGSISFLYYADRINQLPVGVIGVAV